MFVLLAKNNYRQTMIRYVEKKFSLPMSLGSNDQERFKILDKLNNSYHHHVEKFQRNVAKCVEKLLLNDSNPLKDPQHALVLVSATLRFSISYCLHSTQMMLKIPGRIRSWEPPQVWMHHPRDKLQEAVCI